MYRAVLAVVAGLALVAMLGCGSKAPQPPPKAETPAFTASVTMLDSMTVASISKTGPHTGITQTVMDLFAWLNKAKVQPAGGPFGVYLTGPEVPQDSAKWEVCFPVPPGTKGDKGVMVGKMPTTQVAMTMYMGPYDKVGSTYDQLMKWIDENGYVVAGPAMEFYLSDPQKTPAESLRSNVALVVKTKPQAQAPTK
jgi:DNA gyrase inhibitor GyrI